MNNIRIFKCVRNEKLSWAQWLKPIILDTWKVEIGSITVQGQTGQKGPFQPIAGPSVTSLSLQLHGEAQIGKMWSWLVLV
jgi:hypothetical protein